MHPLLKKPSTYLAALLVAALALAVLLHAASMAATRSAPGTARDLMGSNGIARANAAMAAVTRAAQAGEDPAVAARSQRGEALAALRSDPLLPDAHAVLALSSGKGARAQLVALARQLQRRDLSLQGQALQHFVEQGDFERSIETVDQILRVHPERGDQFFPVLGKALQDERSIAAFARVLDGSARWQTSFLSYAVGQSDLLTSLRKLRPDLRMADEKFDKRLVWRLGAELRFAEARAAYEQLPVARERGVGTGRLGWSAEYWPFDWRFVSNSGLRGQLSLDGERLEVFARANRGGLVAERALSLSGRAIDLRLSGIEGKPADLANIEVSLRCAEPNRALLARSALAQGETVLRIDPAQADCTIARLQLSVQARRAPSTLRATIGDVAIAPL